MMTLNTDMLAGFQRHIEAEAKRRIQEEVEAIADAACKELRQKIMAQADAMALSVMAHYEARMMGPNLTITVKKLADQ